MDYIHVNYAQPHPKRTAEILKKYPQLSSLCGPSLITFFWILGLVSMQIGIAVWLESSPWWSWILAGFTIGALADHALFVLIHECAHNSVFRKTTPNLCTGILANFPIVFPSAIAFRNYHMMHHRYQGDVERDADLSAPLEAKMIGNTAFGKTIWMLFFFLIQTIRVYRLKKIRFLDRWVFINFIVQISFLAVLVTFSGWGAFWYLFFSSIFSIGFNPLGARWIQEHFVVYKNQETYSYYGPLNGLAFNVGYHNEHHDLMAVPWNKLPEVRRVASEYYDNLHYHTSWTKLWLKFIFDPKLSLYSRVVRP